MTTHLGHEPRASRGPTSGNSFNGKTSKRIKGQFGEVEVRVPRDRAGQFETQFVKKGQRRLRGFDEKVIALYARGMTTRAIQGHLQDLYRAEVSETLISNVTDAVLEEVRTWRGRPLEAVYPIVHPDAIHLKLASRLKRLGRYAAIIIDDIGYVQQSRDEMEVLFTLLAERYERGSVMLTSNLPFSKWEAIFKDPMTTAAAIDRLVHHSVILELNIPSYRLEASKKKAASRS